jgi:hypothetical protein
MGFQLARREVPGLQLDSPLTSATSHDGLFAFLCPDGSVHLFNSDGPEQSLFPPPDRSITSRVSSIAISPAHALAFAGFEDGSVQLWDLGLKKAVKGIAKARKGAISHCAFVGDFDICVFDDQLQLTLFTVSSGLFGFSLKESPLSTFRTFAGQLLVPPIHHPVEGLILKAGNRSHCTAPKFANYIGISMFNRFVVAEIRPAFRIVLDRAAGKGVADFFSPDPEILFVAVAATTHLFVYKFTGGDPEVVYEKPMELSAKCVAFLSESVVAIVQANQAVLLVTFADGRASASELPGQGLVIRGRNSIELLSQQSLTSFFLPSFYDQMESFKAVNDVAGAVAFCKRAIAGATDATVGLPLNSVQRSLVIENHLSSFLEISTKERLRRRESPAEVACFLIDLAKELSMEEWIGQSAVLLFRDANAVDVFLAQVIAADPSAQLFSYHAQFAQLALENSTGSDISEFLAALPPKIVSSAALLKYALREKNFRLAATVYIERFGDPISALSVLYTIERYDEAFSILKGHLNKKAVLCLFSKSGSEFSRVVKLITFNPELALDILKEIQQSDTPFSLAAFINALLVSFADSGIESDSPLFKFVENMILISGPIEFCRKAIEYLLSSVFRDRFAAPDRREALLLWILDLPELTNGFKRAILPACEAFSFSDARQTIRTTLRLSRDILEEMVNTQTGDPFLWIEENVGADTRSDIEFVLTAHADALAARDFTRFVGVLKTHFPDLVRPIVSEFKDANIRGYYIYQFLIANNVRFADLIRDVVPFVVTFYPQEMFRILKSYGSSALVDLMELFDRSGLIECCAFLAEKAANWPLLTDYIELLIVHRCESSVPFLKPLMVSLFANSEDPVRLLHRLAKCFLASLAGPDANVGLICESLHDLVESAIASVGYDAVLAYCVQAFNPLGAEKLEQVMAQLLKGQSFDEEATARVARVLRRGLQRSEVLNGVICAHCRLRLFAEGTGVKVLNCGHAIHGTPFCMKNFPDCANCAEH